MKIVLKVYPQDSHYNATFPLARGLKAEGCEVVYAGDEERRAPVEAQGFTFHPQREDLLPKMVPGAPQASVRGPFANFKDMIAIWTHRSGNGLARIRPDGFDELIAETGPDALLVDSPYARFSPAIFKHRIPFGILESMMRLDYRPGVPPPSSEHVPTGRLLSRLGCALRWRRYWLNVRLFQLIGWHVVPSKRAIRELLDAVPAPQAQIDFRRYFHVGIASVPEFILSPAEFDLPGAPKPNQAHVGPSVDLQRTETGYDYLYARKIRPFLEQRDSGVPLIYCSLGTASWRYRGIEDFFRRVVAAAAGQPWNLAIALGGELEARAFHPLPTNVVIFQKVPQLELLRHAAAAITHGGMNTVAECIRLKVPMLVFPGTSDLDQPGNAARVVYHGIGLKGGLRRDTVADLRAKIRRLLDEPRFREKISALCESWVHSPAHREGARIVIERLRQHAPR
jgi:UDP:flavonoid glycosyltransferase YjiC (YdhE family)